MAMFECSPSMLGSANGGGEHCQCRRSRCHGVRSLKDEGKCDERELGFAEKHLRKTPHMDSYGGFLKWGGTPKSSIFIGFSIINQPFWGTPISAWALTPNFLADCNQLRRIYLLSLGRLKTNGSLAEIFSAGIGIDL